MIGNLIQSLPVRLFAWRSAVGPNNAWTNTGAKDTFRPIMSPALRAPRTVLLAGFCLMVSGLVCAHAAVSAQGGEFPVSGELVGDQTWPGAAINANGGWAIWQDPGIDGKGLGIGARRLDSGLNPSGAAFRFNSITPGDQEKPRIALLGDGGAVGVWQGGRQGFQNIYARFIRPDGTFATSDVLVNEPAFSKTLRRSTNWLVFRNNRPMNRTQRIKEIIDVKQERGAGPAVSVLNDGTVVVAYASGRKFSTNSQTLVHRFRWNGYRFITNSVLQYVPSVVDPMQDVYLQLFTSAGEKIGGEIRANQTTAFNQHSPVVAALSDGSFVVVWAGDQQRASNAVDVVARRFSPTGAPLEDEIVVNSSNVPCAAPSVAGSANGGFTVVWSQRDAVTKWDVYARAFSSSAVPVSDAFRLNEEVRGDQQAAQIASGTGGQLVVWTSMSQDGSREGVYGRWLNDGSIVTAEFRVNTTTHLRQFMPAVAADGGNRILAIWSSYQTLAGFDLFGQRYSAQ